MAAKGDTSFTVDLDLRAILGRGWLWQVARNDRATWILTLANASVIIIAILHRWQLGTVVWVYWVQSSVIGYFKWRRILNITRFTADGVTINGQPMQLSKSSQQKGAALFAWSYGGLHFAYLIFLWTAAFGLPHDTTYIAVIALSFFINEWVSYRGNKPRIANLEPNIGLVIFFPFARVLPIHIVCIIGLTTAPKSLVVIVGFLLLKMVADVFMHSLDIAIAANATKTQEKLGQKGFP
jgi:hypothetical protein